MAINIFQDLLTPETSLSYAQNNVYIAVTQGVYAAKSLGIDSCIVLGFDPIAYSKILKLPSNIVPTVLITLGYANAEPYPNKISARRYLFLKNSFLELEESIKKKLRKIKKID